MRSFLFFVLIVLGTFSTVAQNNDIILKTNGEEMEGTVKEINDDTVKFVYKNESVNYNVKKSDIVKITFASGRIEFFNKTSSLKGQDVNIEDHHNRVAILPFAYIKDESKGSEVISNRIQQEAFSVFSKHNGELKYQDPRTTNALLIKAGVTNNNIDGFTMGEICHVLGVEYVIQGTVSVEKTQQNTFSSSNATITSKRDNKVHVDKKGNLIGNIFNDNKVKTSSSSSSTTVQNYSTSMIMNIYNDRGSSIFSQDHTAFWNTQDAYKITLKYLAKRTPFYKK
ncbi:hypothetical protein [Snuella lapsa]|uniref:Uncharacterized protein n=1 Tax=Snuella lapsa TaxID=870481 RepID=A0ABP6X193_9FLAO